MLAQSISLVARFKLATNLLRRSAPTSSEHSRAGASRNYAARLRRRVRLFSSDPAFSYLGNKANLRAVFCRTSERHLWVRRGGGSRSDCRSERCFEGSSSSTIYPE